MQGYDSFWIILCFVLSPDPWDFTSKMKEILSLVKQMQNGIRVLRNK